MVVVVFYNLSRSRIYIRRHRLRLPRSTRQNFIIFKTLLARRRSYTTCRAAFLPQSPAAQQSTGTTKRNFLTFKTVFNHLKSFII